MIITKYRCWRRIFAVPGADLAKDGLPEWPVAKMRINGFSDTITMSSVAAFPVTFSCNGEAADAVKNVDEYDWFVSQRTDDRTKWPFLITRVPVGTVESYSGSIRLALSALSETEYPSPWTEEAIETLWFNVDVYVKRRSDGAVQRFPVLPYLRDNISDEEVEVFGARAPGAMVLASSSASALVAPVVAGQQLGAGPGTGRRGQQGPIAAAAGRALVAAPPKGKTRS